MMNSSPVNLHSRGLEITTAKLCPVNCAPFCPNGTVFVEHYGDDAILLSYDDFALAIEKTPRDVMIIFAGFSEPFVNRHCMDMIELAKSRGHTVTLSSTLVGLKPEDVPRLKAVDWFSLHAPDNGGFAHIQLTQTFKDTFASVFTTPGIHIDEVMRMDPDHGFFPEDRAGNAKLGYAPRHVYGPFYCHKLTKAQPVLLPNLDVQLCCEDWSLQHRLGNLRENTYEEIVNSDLFRLISDRRWSISGSELCRSCSRAWSLPKAAAIEVGWKSYQRLYKWARKSSEI